jgi:hypothetical protein
MWVRTKVREEGKKSCLIGTIGKGRIHLNVTLTSGFSLTAANQRPQFSGWSGCKTGPMDRSGADRCERRATPAVQYLNNKAMWRK